MKAANVLLKSEIVTVGISRIDQFEKNNFGYYVRLKRQGKQVAKFFSDSKYGGQNKAQQAAQTYYQELLEQFPAVSQAGRKTVRNTSGYVGVSKTSSLRKGHEYEYWQACWGSGADRKSVKFSIQKYGTIRAKQLAIQARRSWEQEAVQPASVS